LEGNRFVDIEVQAYKNGVGPTAAPTYLNGGIIFISLADPEASKPEAAINYHPSGAAANQCVFDGLPSVTTAAGAKITKYAWDVGDATTASAAAGVTTINRGADRDRLQRQYCVDGDPESGAIRHTTVQGPFHTRSGGSVHGVPVVA
jgi:hypothetical protein